MKEVIQNDLPPILEHSEGRRPPGNTGTDDVLEAEEEAACSVRRILALPPRVAIEQGRQRLSVVPLLHEAAGIADHKRQKNLKSLDVQETPNETERDALDAKWIHQDEYGD